MGKDNEIADNNPAFGAELERTSIADGELLDSVDSLVYTYDKDLSYKSHPDLIGARYMEISVFHVKAGHGEEWRKLGKLVKDAHDKAGTSAHWSMYEIAYGTRTGIHRAQRRQVHGRHRHRIRREQEVQGCPG